jgi:hypothetical protein
MTTIEFKKIFDFIAKSKGFERAYSGWFKESSECIAVLDLQKSNYGNYYELNIKFYIQGMFGRIYKKSKDLVKKDIGDIFTRQPNEYRDVFDLDSFYDEETRKEKLEDLFSKYIVPITNEALTKAGIRKLESKEEIFLLPAVKIALDEI